MVLKAKDYRPEIQEFSFESLTPSFNKDAKIKGFELKSLNNASAFKNNISDAALASERKAERGSAFRIDSKVRESRGLNQHESREIESLVTKEVEARVAALKDAAYKEGYSAGEQQGYAEAAEKAQAVHDQQIAQLGTWLEELRAQFDQILVNGQQDAYHSIKHLIKWILLKEVDNQDYVQRLLEKLILEMNARSNFVVRVNQSAFSGMEDILKKVQERVGKLTNVRVEAHLDLNHPGMILECENGIVDGSLEAQFAALDTIFESVIRTYEA